MTLCSQSAPKQINLVSSHLRLTIATVFFCLLSQVTFAEPIKITLLQNAKALNYSDEVRLSQVYYDAQQLTDVDIYPLGIRLIDPSKSALIDTLKKDILLKLRQLNTEEARNLIIQLNRSYFVYSESVETDMMKVRVDPKTDPLVKRNYWLLLPNRPDHITVFSPRKKASQILTMKLGRNLRQYLADTTGDQFVDSVWVIQADKEIHHIQKIQWGASPYFLSPGAIVFTGLKNLPDAYRDLNANIARLLAFRLEL